MISYPPSFNKLVDLLRRLPGVGPRSAERIALFILREDASYAEALATALVEARRGIHTCPITGFYCETERSSMLDDPRRDPTLICVVEHAPDVMAFERSNAFNGIYFVLGGCLSPLDDIGPEQLRIPQLVSWVGSNPVSEVILGLNPDVKGETTALHIAAELRPIGVRVSRLATGISAGANLEYADPLTLSHALGNRKALD